MFRQDFRSGLIIGAACGAVLAVVLMILVQRVRDFIENRRFRRSRPAPVAPPASTMEHPAIDEFRRGLDDSHVRWEKEERARARSALPRDGVIPLTKKKAPSP